MRVAHLVLAPSARQQGRFEEATPASGGRHQSWSRTCGPPSGAGVADGRNSKGERSGIPPRRLRAEEAELLERDAKLAAETMPFFFRPRQLPLLLDEYDRAKRHSDACEKRRQGFTSGC